jgi:hypothetical protein
MAHAKLTETLLAALLVLAAALLVAAAANLS